MLVKENTEGAQSGLSLSDLSLGSPSKKCLLQMRWWLFGTQFCLPTARIHSRRRSGSHLGKRKKRMPLPICERLLHPGTQHVATIPQVSSLQHFFRRYICGQHGKHWEHPQPQFTHLRILAPRAHGPHVANHEITSGYQSMHQYTRTKLISWTPAEYTGR